MFDYIMYYTGTHGLFLNSKTVPWFSPIHKEENEQCFIHDKICLSPRIYVRALGPCYLPLNQTTSCQYKLSSRKCSRLDRYNPSCRVRIEIKHRYTCFIVFYCTWTRTYIWFCDNTRVPMFYFLILIWFDLLVLYLPIN